MNDKLREVIEQAYENSLRRTDLQFTIYLDEDGNPYEFTDVAGGNSMPMKAWEGKHKFVCSFCNQCWCVEDIFGGDSEDMINTLKEFIEEPIPDRKYDEEFEEEEDELDYFSRLKETFPDAYEKFSEYCIDTAMENFDPDYYIDG